MILSLLLAAPLYAQDAASVAMLVTEAKVDGLDGALKSADAVTRATSARVILVRGVDTLLPQVREALAAEKDASAAREQIRAIVLLGTDEDVAFAASHRERFPASIDGDFAEAVGRIGTPRATSLYIKHVVGSRDPAPAVDLALWGRASMASGTASRLMGANDAVGFGAVMGASAKASVILDQGVVTAALSSSSANIATAAVWYLVELYAFDPAKMPTALREQATAPREHMSVEEEFGRELIRRMLGAKFISKPSYLACLRSAAVGCLLEADDDVRRFLTLEEQTALDPLGSLPRATRMSTHPVEAVSTPDFMLSIVLPPGLGEAILEKTKCREAWIGVVKASVDRIGRVKTVDLTNVGAPGGCAKALETMLRLSLAKPQWITSLLESSNLLVVKPRGKAVCFDEDPVSHQVAPRDLLRTGGAVTNPKVIKRIQPVFPASVQRQMKGGNVVIVAESVITKSGCVRDIRLVKQSPWPELNTAAVVALSEWKLEPGKLEGVPVDVIFNLSINFKF